MKFQNYKNAFLYGMVERNVYNISDDHRRRLEKKKLRGKLNN